ncbi:MAG: LytTR family DNA-binding domain-containing protein, partial [Pseudomonadota bacterium]
GLRGQREGWVHAGVFGVFVLLIVIAPNRFLDAYFYFALAALLTFLFVAQARAMRTLRDEQRSADDARRQLEDALEKATKAEGIVLTLRSAGKLQRIAAKDISTAKGAGDYVELFTRSGSTFLHSGSLNALEKELPAQFLRVHRSHIVNTDLIDELTRLPSGTGELTLTTGIKVPVSKRIMPKVREALDPV